MKCRPSWLIVLLPCAGCTHPARVDRPTAIVREGGNHPLARLQRIEYRDYWTAVRDLNFEAARAHAVTADQSRLADALEAFVRNPAQDSGAGFDALARSSEDSLVRRGALLAATAARHYHGDWAGLLALERLGPAGTVTDRAGAIAWAHAFAGAPAEQVTFPAQAVTVPLETAPSGVPMVAVTVGGRVWHFWIDTGSSITILAADVAMASGVAPIGRDTLEVVTSTGRLAARPAIAVNLALDAIRFTRVPAMIVDPRTLSILGARGVAGRVPVRIDGILGFDVLRRLDLELDDAAGTVTLRDPAQRAHDGPVVRNLFWFGIPLVQLATAEGILLHLSLDTGADQTYAVRQLLVKTGQRATSTERRTVGGFGGATASHGFVIPEMLLFLAGTALRLERVFVYAAEYPTLFSPDGTLGADLMRAGRVRIDATNGILMVLPQ